MKLTRCGLDYQCMYKNYIAQIKTLHIWKASLLFEVAFYYLVCKATESNGYMDYLGQLILQGGQQTITVLYVSVYVCDTWMYTPGDS